MKKRNHLRRLSALVLALLLALSLYGCGQKPDDSKEPQSDPQPSGLESMVIPWGKDGSIIQQAVDSKSMIICFMSGKVWRSRVRLTPPLLRASGVTAPSLYSPMDRPCSLTPACRTMPSFWC